MGRRTDALSAELVHIEGELEEAASALQDAKRRSSAVREQRRHGRSFREISSGGPDPLRFVLDAVDRLRRAAARLRRAEMSALREEGATTTDIADQFGITHQRVSRILRSPDAAGPTPAS